MTLILDSAPQPPLARWQPAWVPTLAVPSTHGTVSRYLGTIRDAPGRSVVAQNFFDDRQNGFCTRNRASRLLQVGYRLSHRTFINRKRDAQDKVSRVIVPVHSQGRT